MGEAFICRRNGGGRQVEVISINYTSSNGASFELSIEPDIMVLIADNANANYCSESNVGFEGTMIALMEYMLSSESRSHDYNVMLGWDVASKAIGEYCTIHSSSYVCAPKKTGKYTYTMEAPQYANGVGTWHLLAIKLN